MYEVELIRKLIERTERVSETALEERVDTINNMKFRWTNGIDVRVDVATLREAQRFIDKCDVDAERHLMRRYGCAGDK
jgi:hypothetical protein